METNDQEMPQMNYLDLALTCTNRLSDMIGRLLDVRALESQKIELRLEAIDARNVIDRLIQNYAAISVDKQQTISKNYTYENPIIEVDENFLIQVLDNLISNALKFAKQNTEVKILVSGNDSDVLITVKDQGPGISEEDQSKLFGEFVKLSATPTGKEKSTGLGLSIVKKYVELMKGTISCKSKLGEGSEFIVAFKRLNNQSFQT